MIGRWQENQAPVSGTRIRVGHLRGAPFGPRVPEKRRLGTTERSGLGAPGERGPSGRFALGRPPLPPRDSQGEGGESRISILLSTLRRPSLASGG